MTEITYRPTKEADLSQIRAINAYYILHTSLTFKQVVPPLSSLTASLRRLQSLGLPHLVAVESVAGDGDGGGGEKVLGYACLSPYRSSYAPTTELSLFVHPEHQSRAIGSALLQYLLDMVKRGEVLHKWRDENAEDEENRDGEGDEVKGTLVRNVIAVTAVDPEGKDGGDALRRFYKKRGFEECGRMKKVGFKRGHW